MGRMEVHLINKINGLGLIGLLLVACRGGVKRIRPISTVGGQMPIGLLKKAFTRHFVTPVSVSSIRSTLIRLYSVAQFIRGRTVLLTLAFRLTSL